MALRGLRRRLGRDAAAPARARASSSASPRSAGAMNERSLSPTTRGLSPACTARIPSSVRMRSSASAEESARSRAATGRKMTFAAPTPSSVAMNAVEIAGPSIEGFARFWSTCTSPITVPMIPIVGREAAGLLERGRAGGVARRHAVDLGVEDLAHELRVGAVDDELKALAREVVVDLGELRVERQQALAARLLGERDDQLHAPAHVELGRPERELVERRDLLHRVHPDARERRAAGADEHDDERRDVEERHRLRPLHHGGEQQRDRRPRRFRWRLQPSSARVIGGRRRTFNRRSAARRPCSASVEDRRRASRGPRRRRGPAARRTTIFAPLVSVTTVSGVASTVRIMSGLRWNGSASWPRRWRTITCVLLLG